MTKSEKPKSDKPDKAPPAQDKPAPVHYILDAETGFLVSK
jgi:hypothetical protein